ncbi:hypothetical protein AB0L63_07330 [Nocardia sp. NPDC051990]|uniref:hypothetical protein n=1 Tax=Nocardia sp. NPDC051990 TaxID=3155285 RepID=UPI0034227627
MRDKQSTDRSEIAALAERVANARGRLPLQDDAALIQALSDAEIDAEREFAQWVRKQRRGQRKRAVQDEIAAEKRNRRTTAAIQRADDADARWHRRALAARRRVSNQDARLAQLYRRAEWSSRALIAVVVLGMVWAGVNVQHNLAPSGNMADPLYWLSYGIEAMISIPIITIMVAATTAARWGRELDRGKVVFFETALLGTTVALNTGPHLAAGSFGQAAEYAIAPVMVGVVIWLHAWVSARYAMLIDGVPLVEDEPDLPPRHRVTTERGAPIDTFRADDPTDRRELLAAKGFDPLLDQAGVRFPVEVDAHVAEAAMRAAQPDPVPVARLDCTETLVYAHSTRSTNGRRTQPIPSDDYQPDHAVRASESLHDTARTFTDTANDTLPADTSSATAKPLGENAFHVPNLDHRVATDTAASVSASAPHATTRIESPTASARALIEHTPTAATEFAPQTAADEQTTFATTGRESQTAAPSTANTHDEHTTVTAGFTRQTAADERTAIAATGHETRTDTPAADTPDEPSTVATAGFEPQTAAAIAAEERSTFAAAGFGSQSAADARATFAATGHQAPTGTPNAANTRDGRTTATDIGIASAAAASAREHTTSDTSGVAVRMAPAAADRTALPVSGDDLRTAAAAAASASDQHVGSGFESDATTIASARGARTTSVVGEAESRTIVAQSQLSIFDAAAVEAGYDTVDATSDRAEADPNRATASRDASAAGTGADASHPGNSSTGAETHTHASAPAGAPTPAKPSTRAENSTRTSPPGDASSLAKSGTHLETVTRTGAPDETQRTDQGSATPAERITRAMDVRPTSRTDDSATDPEDQTADAEVRQLVSDDAARRTTSEVISDVVQSLSAENLLTENVGSGSDDIEVWSVARAIAGRGLSVIPVEQLAEILMLADQSWTPTSIGAEVGLSRTAIAQVLEFARRVRRPYAISS